MVKEWFPYADKNKQAEEAFFTVDNFSVQNIQFSVCVVSITNTWKMKWFFYLTTLSLRVVDWEQKQLFAY